MKKSKLFLFGYQNRVVEVIPAPTPPVGVVTETSFSPPTGIPATTDTRVLQDWLNDTSGVYGDEFLWDTNALPTAAVTIPTGKKVYWNAENDITVNSDDNFVVNGGLVIFGGTATVSANTSAGAASAQLHCRKAVKDNIKRFNKTWYCQLCFC